MKAIIPVAGAGTNLRPHTYTQPKALIPMAGDTILSVIIDEIRKWNIQEYIFIIGYLGDKIQHYITQKYPDIQYTFVHQNERKGTAHAISLTQEAVDGDEIVIVYGDTICSLDTGAVLNSKDSLVAVKRVTDPRAFGVAEVDSEMNVVKLTEKPTIPKSNYAMVGIFKIKETDILYSTLKEYLKSEKANDGEYHFTDALQKMIESGVKMVAYEVKNWYDCGKKESLLETNASLLKRMQRNNLDTTHYDESVVIIPPVHIGKECTIKNAIIGPYVSVGENTMIQSSIVSNSIIGAFSKLDEIVLKSSIIGSDAVVHGLSQSLNIGDNTEIDLG